MSQSGGTGERDLKSTFKAQLSALLSEKRIESSRKVDGALAELGGNANNATAYLEAAEAFQDLDDLPSTLEWLRKGLAARPDKRALHCALIQALHSGGLDQQALAVIDEARQRWPGDAWLLLRDRLYLPIVHDSQEDVDRYAARYAAGLACLPHDIDVESSRALEHAYEALPWVSTFHLGYQGYDCLQAQRQYGTFLHGVMSRKFPQWSVKDPREKSPAGRALRVGYLSSCFFQHTVGKLFRGWIASRNSAAYECYCYMLGGTPDAMTDFFRRGSDCFRQFPSDVEAVCGRIVEDDLDILVYVDIGMHPLTTMLAALRLAPVQCVSWGHPLTTGLPTIDYFLSSQLMEPPGAQRHYSERLVALPNLGIYYDRPAIPRPLLLKTREDYGLRQGATVYFCCQSTFKYLPKYDGVFPEIASRVPAAQFLFVCPNQPLADKFLARLDRAFLSRGLRAADFCRILPPQNALDFWNLYRVSDIYLDSLGWSGGKTTLDAVALRLPIVTWPGEFMRGRHSYAILTLLDANETIAKDVEDYIRIAVRLAKDTEWRQRVRAAMETGEPKLWSDRTSVEALERFFAEVARRRP
jgi:predicted O-linked N-acetylglucosamine transferase (SPINDLY family)